MRVTEKCDVYSFGVVVLEMLLGKHPGDFLATLPSMENPTVLVKDVIDQRLPPPSARLGEALAFIMSIALACTRTHPESRPTMHFVVQQLSALEQTSLVEPFCTVTLNMLTGFHK